MANLSPAAVAPANRGFTMAVVAKHAGVSRTAVSFVLGNREHASISEETKLRILDAVQALGYRPNAGARALASQRSDWYGLVTEIVTAPFAVNIIKGAQDQAWLDKRFLLIASTEQAVGHTDSKPTGKEHAAVEKLLEQRVAGILYAATWHRAVNVPEIVREIPTVLINCFDAQGTLPSIVPDERGGGPPSGCWSQATGGSVHQPGSGHPGGLGPAGRLLGSIGDCRRRA